MITRSWRRTLFLLGRRNVRKFGMPAGGTLSMTPYRRQCCRCYGRAFPIAHTEKKGVWPLEFQHKSVLLQEAVEALSISPEGIYIDGTAGGGGHSQAILRLLGNGKLISIDQDRMRLQCFKALCGKPQRNYFTRGIFFRDGPHCGKAGLQGGRRRFCWT